MKPIPHSFNIFKEFKHIQYRIFCRLASIESSKTLTTEELPALCNAQHHLYTTFLRDFTILEGSLWLYTLLCSLPKGLVCISGGKQLII